MDNLSRRVFRQRSLVGRVLIAVLTLFFLGGLIVAIVAWQNGTQAARQSYDRLLLGAATDIAETIRIVDGGPATDLPVSAFELLAQAPDDRIAYALRGPEGTLITGHAWAPTPPSTARRSETVFFDGAMQGEDARFVQLTRRFAELDFSGVVTVTVGHTLQARKAMALDLVLHALIPAVAAGLALMLSAFFVIRSAMRPLATIAQDLSGRDPHDLTPMDATNVPSEVGVIVNAMNRFMGRLDRQVESMQHLISDTAHQLRTPVAAIRAHAEMAVETDERALATASLQRLLRRTRSLGNLLDQLLARALVIHRTESQPRETLDLRDIALGVVETRDHEYLAPDVEVELSIGEAPAMVRADAFSLEQAAANLLSNALKYGKPPVRVGVSTSTTDAWLWVEDAGSGPGEAALSQGQRRFERSGSTRESGTGLGLSIVTEVAAAFGGTLEMEPTSRGFRASLCLPRSGGARE
ncbi:sensor histidine kinase [Tropicimonas marinistellae]|uniref:sensor histidine kinase n=1 Tax=Tropicimonas marinistellae TaxID=1739787 RepID=UPI0008361BF0|nr:sensor histidine kinase [Tropicimonas marinistellae]